MAGPLSEAVLHDVMRQGLWAAAVMSLPILAVALAAGLVIGLLQALTSVQEATLTFVPKLAAIAAVFWVTMGFMTGTLVSFLRETVAPLIAGG
ncbi:Flagellar biosynthesis pathway, component FliQ [Rubellimicrobium thermophilum DSM 16684]|uniref:Flagellar biosynthesis pathway, component FliQ n=1 Tax=Rubellimicrobium thermophilum DSM 16684 TaxID=1123069 RepID=S9QX66_9RHOB|nr:flagellar biosynthetic protein FliQ [Rubellimicrobium thermophilum]EPX84157.1 Flagellar biosynthesis pathway, component FliQ [Rubellimicrobium thermophilum DSM 16684]